jgi:hypothetical protein
MLLLITAVQIKRFTHNSYYCAVDVDFNAGITASKVAGQERCMHKQAQAVGPVILDVRRRL